jgi:hypothetical protein
MSSKCLPPVKNILFFFSCLVLISCSDSNDKLIDELKAIVEADEKMETGYTVVELAELTDFDWDTLYYFHQLDDKKYISQQIGFKWDGEAVPNLQRRFLFVKDGKVVSYSDYAFNDLPITLYGCSQDRWVYPRSRASFAAFKYCRGDEFSFPFIPVPCINEFQEMVDADCPAAVTE